MLHAFDRLIRHKHKNDVTRELYVDPSLNLPVLLKENITYNTSSFKFIFPCSAMLKKNPLKHRNYGCAVGMYWFTSLNIHNSFKPMRMDFEINIMIIFIEKKTQ